jgi:hypothetical protein
MSTAQIQSQIDSVGRYLPSGVAITFQFTDGTYTLTTNLTFSGFYGGGLLVVQGNIAEANANTLHTTQSVFLDARGYDCNGLDFNGISLQWVTVLNLKIAVDTTDYRYGIYMNSNVRSARVAYCYVSGTTTAGNGTCILFWVDAVGMVQSTYVSNAYFGIQAGFFSRCYSENNASTGTLPAYGLYAAHASNIGKAFTQPSGSTANQSTQYGGQILP